MTDLDSLVGQDLSLEARIVARAQFLATHHPHRVQPFIDGLPLQGIRLTSPLIAAGLEPFLHLPKPEPRTHKRARMAATMQQLYAANGCVSEQDLKAQNFDEIEIRDLGREAFRIAGLDRMAA